MRLGFLLLTLFSALCTTTLASTEDALGYLKQCAKLDLEVISDIEQAGNAQQASGERLAAAFFSVMKARNACAEGRQTEAIAIYDSISFE